MAWEVRIHLPLMYQVKAIPKRQFLNFIRLEFCPASPRGWSLGTVSKIEVRYSQPLAPDSLGQLGQGVNRCKKSKCWHFRCGRHPARPKVKHSLPQHINRVPWSSASRKSTTGQGQALWRQHSF